MCGNMADIQSPTAEIRRGKKIDSKKEKDRNHGAKNINFAQCRGPTMFSLPKNGSEND